MLANIFVFLISLVVTYFTLPYLNLVEKEDLKNLELSEYNTGKKVMLVAAGLIITIVAFGVVSSIINVL